MPLPFRDGPRSFLSRLSTLIAMWLVLATPALRSQQAEPYPGLDAYVTRAEWISRTLDPTFVTFAVGPENTVEMLKTDLLGDHMVLRRKAPADH